MKLPLFNDVKPAPVEDAEDLTFSLPEETAIFPGWEALSAARTGRIRQQKINKAANKHIVVLRITLTSLVSIWHICRVIITQNQAPENRPNPSRKLVKIDFIFP